MKQRLKSAALWLFVLALAAGSMALPWMVCQGYDRQLFAAPRPRPATDLGLSAAARENDFVSQLYERQSLLGGWGEGWGEPVEAAAAEALAGEGRLALGRLAALEGLPPAAAQAVRQTADGPLTAAWRDELGFVRLRWQDVYLVVEPVTGLPARLSVYGPAAGQAVQGEAAFALLEEYGGLLAVDGLGDWERAESAARDRWTVSSFSGRLRLGVSAGPELLVLEAASLGK